MRGIFGRRRVWDRTQAEAMWRADVAEHGWVVVGVPSGHAPVLQYTVGLTEQGRPELITFGLPAETGAAILNDLAERLVRGIEPVAGMVVPDLVEGEFEPQLWPVTVPDPPIGVAVLLYGDRVRCFQLVTPDAGNRMPWEDGYADAPDCQPLLFVPPRRPEGSR